MGRFVEPRDLAPYADIPEAKALAMIEDAEAEAILAAPCITALAPEDPKRDAIRALLRQAIPRRHGADTRVVTQAGAGPFQKPVEPQRATAHRRVPSSGPRRSSASRSSAPAAAPTRST